MKNYDNLPLKILSKLYNKPYKVINVGLSGAEVRNYDDFVLKIQPHTEQSVNEVAFMRYLKGKVLAPEVAEYEMQDGKDYLLMSKLDGEMLCADKFLANQTLLFEKAGEALFALWKLPINECPCDMRFERKLSIARHNVEHNNVDLNLVNPKMLGVKGRFKTPEALLQWLIDNRPREDLCVSHGDFCLPNIIVCGNNVGVIDFPYGGVADKYCDIALLRRSVKSNLRGEYGGKTYAEFDEKLFFDVLGVTPDYDKLEYYVLLDELF